MLSVLLWEKHLTVVLSLALVTLAGVPALYSYVYHKKQVKAGAEATSIFKTPTNQIIALVTKVSLVFTAVILAVAGILLVTGDIEIQYHETAFTVRATYWRDLNIQYADIQNVEYLKKCPVGIQTNGFSGPRIQMGAFQNDAFGAYTRYAYTRCKDCVVIIMNSKTLMINGKDSDRTKAIYEELIKRLEKRE